MKKLNKYHLEKPRDQDETIFANDFIAYFLQFLYLY